MLQMDPRDPRPWTDPEGGLDPSERVRSHYADPMGVPAVPDHDLGSMETREQRMAVMSGMRENTGAIGENDWATCSSTALLGGAVYGGGEKGVIDMINATEKYEKLKNAQDAEARKKAGLPPLPKESVDLEAAMKKQHDGGTLSRAEQQAIGDAQMDALKAKLAKGGDMSSADMQMMQKNVYHALNNFQEAQDDTGHGAGVNDAALVEFMKTSPAIAKMFTENHMHLEQMDQHIVLGVGDPMANPNAPSMILDPQARAKHDENGKETGLDSQLITDPGQLYDYKDLIHGEIDAKGEHSKRLFR